MGAIRLRGKIWYIDYRWQGRRIKERIGPKKTLARQVLAKREAEAAEGRFFPSRLSEIPTFREAAQLYWEQYAKFKKAGSSTRSYVKRLTETFGAKRLNEIGVLDIQTFLNEKRNGGVSPATINRYHTFLRSIINRAIEWEKFSGPNPASKIKKLPENNSRLRYLSKEEIAALLGACHPRIYPIVLCGVMTGMRRGEILGLQWENVDLKHGIIYVLKSKSGKPREIPIASALSEMLGTMGHSVRGCVFEIPLITLVRYFDKALAAAGIKNFRFHDLRHTFSSYFIMRTQDLPSLQKILGHASPVMTQRYAHLASSHQAVNIATFEAGLKDLVPNWSQGVSRILQNEQNSLEIR